MRRKTLSEMQADNLVTWWNEDDIEKWCEQLSLGFPPDLRGGCFVQLDLQGKPNCIPAPLQKYGRRVRVNGFLSEWFPLSFVSRWEVENRSWLFVEDES